MYDRSGLFRLHLVLGTVFSFCGPFSSSSVSASTDAFLSVYPAERASVVSAIGMTVPSIVKATEGEPLSITATAGSGDPHSIITITLMGAPPGLTFATNTPWPAVLQPWATLSGAPGFQTGGTWLLQWHAEDQLGATDNKTTQLVIADNPAGLTFEARAFTSDGSETIRLWSGRPAWCIQIEPVRGNFELSQIDVSSITISDMRVGGSTVTASVEKSSAGVDRDRNGIEEIALRISRRNLFSLLSYDDGSAEVPLAISGLLFSGGTFRAELTVRVLRTAAGHVRASVAPNPLNPGGTLTFSIRAPGKLTVRVYDLGGRSVRTVVGAEQFPAGAHRISIDARDDRGNALASGVYFYKVETREGASTGRFVVLK